ncbi:MAG TPA: hypothetical protein PLD53_10970, partial [Candidatus Propionivibrio aalborgensis]|nr:hypothetical protein [Candidatus Propionivibrio aalborgensis]
MRLCACREAYPRAECAKQAAVTAVAMARVKIKAIGETGRIEHSEIYGFRYRVPGQIKPAGISRARLTGPAFAAFV